MVRSEHHRNPDAVPSAAAALASVPIAITAGYLAYSRAAIAGLAIGLAVLVALSRNRWALVFHTMLYADFLEDPVTWTLLGAGAALAYAARGQPSGPQARQRAEPALAA